MAQQPLFGKQDLAFAMSLAEAPSAGPWTFQP